MTNLLFFGNVEWWMWLIGLGLVAILYWYFFAIMKSKKRSNRKWLKVVIIMMFSSQLYAQDCETFSAIGVSYVLPKSVSVDGSYFTRIGLTTRVGVSYTPVQHYLITKGDNVYDSLSNQFNIYSLVGWRLFQIDYKVSGFLSTGYIIGDVDHARWLVTGMVLFPVKSNALAIEPIYIHKQGFTGRVSYYFKF